MFSKLLLPVNKSLAHSGLWKAFFFPFNLYWSGLGDIYFASLKAVDRFFIK